MAKINFLEKHLEQIIFETPQEKLRQRGLSIFYDKIFQQVNLGAYGIADVIAVQFNCQSPDSKRKVVIITVYELKQKEVNIHTLTQCGRYISGLTLFIEDNFNTENTDIIYRAVIIGDSVDENGDFVFLFGSLQNVSCYLYDYAFDGIKFQIQRDWQHTDPCFPKNLYAQVVKCVNDHIRPAKIDDLPF